MADSARLSEKEKRIGGTDIWRWVFCGKNITAPVKKTYSHVSDILKAMETGPIPVSRPSAFVRFKAILYILSPEKPFVIVLTFSIRIQFDYCN